MPSKKKKKKYFHRNQQNFPRSYPNRSVHIQNLNHRIPFLLSITMFVFFLWPPEATTEITQKTSSTEELIGMDFATPQLVGRSLPGARSFRGWRVTPPASGVIHLPWGGSTHREVNLILNGRYQVSVIITAWEDLWSRQRWVWPRQRWVNSEQKDLILP